MISKNEIKFVQSLAQKKFRISHQLFIAEGPKVVKELLLSAYEVVKVFALADWINAHKHLLSNTEMVTVSEEELKKISQLVSPNQVLAMAKIPQLAYDYTISQREMVLVLDDIRDPGNMGTMLRIADWFGFSQVVCSENCVDVFSPKSIQAAMGSVFHIHISAMNLVDLFSSKLPDIPVYGTFLEGISLYNTTFTSNGFMVIGNESHGISPEMEARVSHRIHIPRGKISFEGQAESLNASVAAAILCAEYTRQMQR